MYPEYKLVQECLHCIEEKLNWGPSGSWHNDVFIELSERIQQTTHVLLSPTTLKRVWGKVNYNSAPSITTLNTLAQFADFQNWRDFKSRQSTSKPHWITKTVNANLGIIMLAASIMTIIFISFYSLKGAKNKAEPLDVSKVVFTSRPITKGLPNSVVFDVDLDEVKSDSILIQQYWDVTKTIPLKPGQKQATGQYYYPGYFRAKLLVDGTIIKEHDLFIKSEGWLGTLDYDPVPKYILNEDVINGNLSFGATILDEIRESEQPLNTTFHNVGDFKAVSGDNYILETAVRNVYRDKWAVCQQLAILVLGTKSAHIIPFSIPGCVSEIGIMLSDVYLSGKEHDLSGLGLNMSSFRNLKIEVRDKQLTVFSENLILFTRTYKESIGNIVGIRYRFLGAGEIANIRVTDLSGEIEVINDSFRNPDL